VVLRISGGVSFGGRQYTLARQGRQCGRGIPTDLWRHDFLERVEIEAVEVISDFE